MLDPLRSPAQELLHSPSCANRASYRLRPVYSRAETLYAGKSNYTIRRTCLVSLLLLRELLSCARRTPMPPRAASYAPVLSGVVCALLAADAINFRTPALAVSACAGQSAQQAPQGARWVLRRERVGGRKCWLLVDAYGREVPGTQVQPNAASMPSLSSQLLALFGYTTEAPNATPQSSEPPLPHSATRFHRPQARVARDNRGRGDQTSPREGHKGPGGLSQSDREALFEEFLRWHENQEMMRTLSPPPSSR